jgi:hypothetical protein
MGLMEAGRGFSTGERAIVSGAEPTQSGVLLESEHMDDDEDLR